MTLYEEISIKLARNRVAPDPEVSFDRLQSVSPTASKDSAYTQKGSMRSALIIGSSG